MDKIIVAKIVNDITIGEYTVVINHNNDTVTTIIDDRVCMYKMYEDDIISELLVVAPNKYRDDFIVDLLQDKENMHHYFELIKSI